VTVLVIFNACDSDMTDEEILSSDMERMPFKSLVNNQDKAGTKEYATVYAYIDAGGNVSAFHTRILESTGDDNTDNEILTQMEHANFLRAIKGSKNGKEVIFEVTRYYYYNSELVNGKGFVPYDKAPKPVGGFKAIQEKVKYPELAQKAGIEGNVIVQAYITEKGDFTKYQVLVGVENSGLDDSAVEALKQTKFEPAVQKGQPVGVWITIPVQFKLKDSKEELPHN